MKRQNVLFTWKETFTSNKTLIYWSVIGTRDIRAIHVLRNVRERGYGVALRCIMRGVGEFGLTLRDSHVN